MKRKRSILLISTFILVTTLFISCENANREDLSDFRAKFDAYVDVQTEALYNYVYGYCSKEEFLVQQEKNTEFLYTIKDFCPEEFKNLLNEYLDCLNEFKLNDNKESYEKFKASLDNLYNEITTVSNENNLNYDNILKENYINEMKR